MLAKQYEVTSRLNFAEEDRLQNKKYKSIIKHNKNHCAEDVFTSDFTLEELEYAIRRLNLKKSPGHDVIYGQMIVHFGEIAKKYLLNIFITSWSSGKLLKIWKSSFIIPILKPGKDATSCKSYRPISLTCILCKLMSSSFSFKHAYHPSHIHPDTKLACYADDIALWNTHRDVAVSEKALNKTLKGIAAWAKYLKLTINADKTNYCILSTDRRHRGTFNADIKIEDCNIKRVIFSTYLGITLDSELRFTKHIEQTTVKALRKLNILRKLCGTTWGSRPRTLKNAYSSIIRPVLEYAAPIWAPASVSSKQKLDSIQHHSSKIIIGAVSSTNDEKAEREWGLPPLECRRNLATVQFTNKVRCYEEYHISTRVFNEWTYTKRLKRSSTLQLDEDIKIQINLEHSILNFMQEPPFPRRPLKETIITLNLLRPCSKKEDARILKQKGLETIEKISQENFAVAYTDGSSDISLNKGGAGILF
ncbi:reverse transcriptase domain-containing protein [Trichonephila clavipes]|uniref:Reverse transcriptase domain-containing protein n=1 Tax=Trichonephila clavipes TaxID=2585209 RepID=A0A8X6V3L2_TRICX|nr:reverse transcriptase domain-containing protein [Trichonephila clavipes]